MITLQFVGGSLNKRHANVDWPTLPIEHRHSDFAKSAPAVSLTTMQPRPRTRELYLLQRYNSVDGIAMYHFQCDEPIPEEPKSEPPV